MAIYTNCPICGTRQIVLGGKISGHQAKGGSVWAKCPGTGTDAQESE